MSDRYELYINSQAWADKKEQFKQTKLYRQGRCWVCVGWGVEKHIHHLSYDRFGNERMNDLMVLCAVCHAAVHEMDVHLNENKKKMRQFNDIKKRWAAHASRNRLWRMRFKTPMRYALEVARFFNVVNHPFVERIFAEALFNPRMLSTLY